MVALKYLSIEEAKLQLILEEEDGRETQWRIDPFTLRLSGIGRRRNEFEVRTRIEGAVRGEIDFSGSASHDEGMVADPTFFHVSGKGKVFGQAVAVEGKISAPLGLAETDMTVTFPKINMAEIPAIFTEPSAALSQAAFEGVAKLTMKVSGNLQAMGVEAEADLTRAGWTIRPGLRKFIDMPCSFIAQGHRFPDLYFLSNAELRFPPFLVIANASIVPSTGAREWAASARIASLADFARSRGGALQKWAPSGRLTASGKGKRSSASVKDIWNVSMDLGEVGFQLPEHRLDLRALNGHVDFTPETVGFFPLAGLLNGQRFALRGTLSLGAAPVGEIQLSMPYLDADALFPPGEEGGKAKKDAPEPARGKGGEEQPAGFSARGSVKIDAGKARGLDFRNLTGVGRYEGNTVYLESLRAGLYGGEAKISGTIRFRGPSPDFRVKVALKNVAADEILSRRTSLKNFLSGSTTLAVDLSGGMKDFSDFSRSAAGAGTLRVTGGKIHSVDLLDTAAGLSGLRSILPETPGGKSPGKTAETAFSDISADFRIAAGKIRTDALRITSGKLGLSGTAAIGFDRTLEFRGSLLLSRDLSDRARGMAGQLLTDPSGRVRIPLVMSGTVMSPAVAVDAEALAKGLAGRAIRGLLDRVPIAPGASPRETKDGTDTGKTLEGIFEKIFPGKK